MKAGTTTWARIFLQLYLPRALNWKRQSTKFSPFNVGYQVKLQQLQAKRFTAEEKAGVVKSLEQKEHEYFAFFVCRDPIERLKSLYLYSLDLKRFKTGKTPRNFQEFLTVSFSNISSILSESTLLRPTVSKQAINIDGFHLPSTICPIALLIGGNVQYSADHGINPMYQLCAPCSRHYDAIIRMETFESDARYLLRIVLLITH